ncbi:hypothetical protein BUALT_Bualt19G0086300 [Buddleja alternifolia]|uniref:MADS-box domain-containing protein n=1 Tax=Buddleja alternifolia TaxID=168488 RepID=A0AAV6W601_9LAMI|nr:hypothetical protein BUALT_Bualt19G0086300 [Buddleja alternifolia]
MGRAKAKMDLISNKKSRALAFKKRKESLIKKLHELTTLCDVNACMIIHGPNQDNGNIINHDEPETWPRNNPDEVRRMIALYKAKNNEYSGNKTFGLSDFFNEREKKIEDELARIRKKVMEAKYPTWPEFLNFLTEGQLREFGIALNSKAEIVKSRIELLRRNDQGLITNQSRAFYNQQEEYNNMMMLLMDGNEYNCVQFGGASSANGGNVEVFYESMVGPGLAEPVISNVPRPVSVYYGPDVLPLVPELQPPYIGEAAPPSQVQFNYSMENQYHGGCGDEDIFQYQMMNYGSRYCD